MPFKVTVSRFVAAKIAERYGEADEFADGPLAAATHAFADFLNLRAAAGGTVRVVTIVHPVFGATVFIGVRMKDDTIEIADFDADPDFLDLVDGG